ncbi:Uncharacterised protein [Mycobacteroides abscessus subsp. bolletii]|uniref:hypothetical protein n=1 Tax=Mycobacteroides abscessus TaxID=36809 RepID=UPI0009A85BA5|nr:hypothetical protein [Mycobacteroides abscessus]SKX80586.1 Uncharacterised protein [Mycobacteroides abscessus subsp. bolletii]
MSLSQKFVRLTTIDGTEVAVNVSNIGYIEEGMNGTTRIAIAGGAGLYVKSAVTVALPLDEVMRRIADGAR